MENEQVQEKTVEVNAKALESMVNLIDIVSTRGAFRGDELEGVGQFRNNLAKISGMKPSEQNENAAASEDSNEEPEMLTEKN
jgi:hypothetical protein